MWCSTSTPTTPTTSPAPKSISPRRLPCRRHDAARVTQGRAEHCPTSLRPDRASSGGGGDAGAGSRARSGRGVTKVPDQRQSAGPLPALPMFDTHDLAVRVRAGTPLLLIETHEEALLQDAFRHVVAD